MSLFEKKEQISRSELRRVLKKDIGSIPGTRRRFMRKERVAFEKEVFGKKYGPLISRDDYKRGLKELEKAKYRVKSSAERLEIERKVRFFKRLGGIS